MIEDCMSYSIPIPFRRGAIISSICQRALRSRFPTLNEPLKMGRAGHKWRRQEE